MLQQTISSPIYARFHAAAARTPSKTAVRVGSREFSYRELLTKVDFLSDGLLSAGVGGGDHVGVLLPNCIEYVVLFLAAARLGLVLVPQSLGLSAKAIANSFCAADVEHLVAWHGIISGAEPDTFARIGDGVRISVGGKIDGWFDLEEISASSSRLTEEMPEVPVGAPYLMVMTSGSTGLPKPILLSQETKILRADAAASLYGVTTSDVTLAGTPLYHSLAQRLVLLPLMMGGSVIVMEHFTPTNWINIVRCQTVSFSIAVSSQLRQIIEHLEKSGCALPSLRCLVSSSALLDDSTKARLFAHLGCDFHECYGASEIAIATNLSPEAAKRKLGSVGSAIPGADVRILDENELFAAPGMTGEIVCRTPMLYSGYYKQHAITFASQKGEYFRTGDLGKMDDEGFLYFLGRIKDIIISGGVNIYPKDIEDVVCTHPDVLECAAIPVGDDKLGEVIGLVVSRNPDREPSWRDIQRLCMERLGDFQQPRHCFFVDALPRNTMGKIDKPALRQAYSRLEN